MGAAMFDTADTVTGTNALDSATCSDGDDNGCSLSSLVPLDKDEVDWD